MGLSLFFLFLQAQKVGQSLQKWDSWQVCNLADNQHNLGKFGETDNETNGGGCNVYALFVFAVNAPL